MSTPAPSSNQHPLASLRRVDPKLNPSPAQNWNENVIYYSNTPAETNGLFFSSSLGFLELGMEHNTQLVKALRREGNYWQALSRLKKQGYENGRVRVATPRALASGRIGVFAKTAGLLLTSAVGGSEYVHPMGPKSLDPADKRYPKMLTKFSRGRLERSGAKVVQINLITGYENADQREAFSNDAKQIGDAARQVFGEKIFSSETYDPAKQEDRSFGAFARYLYEKTDSLPNGSIVIVEVFTHGDKTPFMHRETPESKLQVARVGVLSWAAKTKELEESGLSSEVNEWEFRQLMNSINPKLTVLVRGNQCMGGQFCEGELVFPKFLAPANR